MAQVKSVPTDKASEATHFRCYKCKTDFGVDQVMKIGSTKDAAQAHIAGSKQGCGWEHIGYNKIETSMPIVA